ncbi:MAG: PepSY domain-containing protein [Pseudomonadota bacterium]
MDSKTLTSGALIGLMLAGGLAAAVSAQTAATETGLTEDEVIAIALAEVPGEVRDVELETEDGQQVYEVEIIGADGIEMEVEIAADTGDVLEVEAETDDEGDDD